jgi:hypothetical protein
VSALAATVLMGVLVLADQLFGDDMLGWRVAVGGWLLAFVLSATESWWSRPLLRFLGPPGSGRPQRKGNSPAGAQGPPR